MQKDSSGYRRRHVCSWCPCRGLVVANESRRPCHCGADGWMVGGIYGPGPTTNPGYCYLVQINPLAAICTHTTWYGALWGMPYLGHPLCMPAVPAPSRRFRELGEKKNRGSVTLYLPVFSAAWRARKLKSGLCTPMRLHQAALFCETDRQP